MLELNESKPIEDLLEKTRLNCVYRENLHRKNYHFWKSKEKYFEIPLIVLSAINSIVAVGLTAYMSQKNVSAVNCLFQSLFHLKELILVKRRVIIWCLYAILVN